MLPFHAKSWFCDVVLVYFVNHARVREGWLICLFYHMTSLIAVFLLCVSCWLVCALVIFSVNLFCFLTKGVIYRSIYDYMSMCCKHLS